MSNITNRHHVDDILDDRATQIVPFRPASATSLAELLETMPNGVNVGPVDVKHLLLRFVERCQQVKKGEPTRMELDAISRLAQMVDNEVQVDADAELISFLAAAKAESAAFSEQDGHNGNVIVDITPEGTKDG